MADVVSPEKRSQMMAGIRAKHTKPELLVRHGLHRLGFRFRLHDKRLPGAPDLVLRRFNAVILIHGCFWHGHCCHLFKWPATREEFWREKISQNRKRDAGTLSLLQAEGWRTCVVWECALRGKQRLPIAELESRLSDWLRSEQNEKIITGRERAKVP